MNKKRSPLKWILGISIVLIALGLWTIQQTQNPDRGLSSRASIISSSNNFFQFLENLFGIRNHGNSASGLLTNQGQSPASGKTSSGTLLNNSTSKLKINQGITSNSDQDNNIATNAENNLIINSENNQTINPGNITENSIESNSELNPNNTGSNADNNGNDNPDNNNPSNNADTNPADNNGNNPDTNLSGNSGAASDFNKGCAMGCFPGCIPGCDPECVPGCSTGLISGNDQTHQNQAPSNQTNLPNQTIRPNLPTINAIPTDTQIAQNVAQKNQANYMLAQLTASNQALADNARKAAQFELNDPSKIKPVDTTPAPSDIVDKIKSAQLIQH